MLILLLLFLRLRPPPPPPQMTDFPTRARTRTRTTQKIPWITILPTSAHGVAGLSSFVIRSICLLLAFLLTRTTITTTTTTTSTNYNEPNARAWLTSTLARVLPPDSELQNALKEGVRFEYNGGGELGVIIGEKLDSNDTTSSKETACTRNHDAFGGGCAFVWES